MTWWINQKLHTQIAICVVIGVCLGLFFTDAAILIEPIGIAFLRLLKMLIVPLTFFTLVAGITKLESTKSLGSIGGLTLLFYALSSLVAGT